MVFAASVLLMTIATGVFLWLFDRGTKKDIKAAEDWIRSITNQQPD